MNTINFITPSANHELIHEMLNHFREPPFNSEVDIAEKVQDLIKEPYNKPLLDEFDNTVTLAEKIQEPIERSSNGPNPIKRAKRLIQVRTRPSNKVHQAQTSPTSTTSQSQALKPE